MYVRTKEGKIFNCFVSENMGKPVYYVKNSLTNGFIDYDDACKVSPDIIDIVQVGDYVNGYYVEDIRHRYDGEMITILEVATGSNYFQAPMYEDDIESIVTKEQFEAMKYEVSNE